MARGEVVVGATGETTLIHPHQLALILPKPELGGGTRLLQAFARIDPFSEIELPWPESVTLPGHLQWKKDDNDQYIELVRIPGRLDLASPFLPMRDEHGNALEVGITIGWENNDFVAPVDYDAVYGFPRAYRVSRGMSSHGGHAVLVESFAPAP